MRQRIQEESWACGEDGEFSHHSDDLGVLGRSKGLVKTYSWKLGVWRCGWDKNLLGRDISVSQEGPPPAFVNRVLLECSTVIGLMVAVVSQCQSIHYLDIYRDLIRGWQRRGTHSQRRWRRGRKQMGVSREGSVGPAEVKPAKGRGVSLLDVPMEITSGRRRPQLPHLYEGVEEVVREVDMLGREEQE